MPISFISKSTSPFSAAPFFRRLSTLRSRSTMVNEHTVDYHPCPSELISRIEPLIFYGLLRGLSLQNIAWIFFSNLYIPRWLRKNLKFVVLRLLENTLSQKSEYVQIYSCPFAKLSPRFLSSPLPAVGNYAIPPNNAFLKIYPSRIEGGLWRWKDNRVTSFDEFYHFCNLYIFGFCFVVLWFRLKHAWFKCESSLT